MKARTANTVIIYNMIYVWIIAASVTILTLSCCRGEEKEINSGAKLYKEGDRWGIKNDNGVVLVPADWDYIDPLSQNPERPILVKKNNLYGYIDREGRILSDPQWEFALPFKEGFGPVGKNEKYGFLDRSGEISIDLEFDSVSWFSEGLGLVKINNKWGFVNENGDVVIKPKWQSAEVFHEERARVMNNEKFGFIDREGRLVIELRWENAFSFSDGLAAVKKDSQWGFVDVDGKVKIRPAWKGVGSFKDGVAWIRDHRIPSKAKWGLIDKNGKILSEIQWEGRRRLRNPDLENEIVIVEKDNIDYYLCKSGEYGSQLVRDKESYVVKKEGGQVVGEFPVK